MLFPPLEQIGWQKMREIFIKEYDYILPASRIASFPQIIRDNAKLLIYKDQIITNDLFKNIAQHLPSHSSLFLNDTRVIEARIFFQKLTGGLIEIFCLKPHQPSMITEALSSTSPVQWQCLIGGASKWKAGQVLKKIFEIEGGSAQLSAKYVSKQKSHFIIEFSWTGDLPFGDVLQHAGKIPLPPYLKREASHIDEERYQTIFALHKGSVASPTASLHFTDDVFAQLAQKRIRTSYLTLHVGAGTFMPVKTENIQDHHMHAENFSISLKTINELINTDTIIAVGTTSLRSLESLHWIGVKLMKGKANGLILNQWEAYDLACENFSYKDSLQALAGYLKKTQTDFLHCQTSLLIKPGYNFKSAQALITNFHQPRSTLLLLVAAFIGEDWKKIYTHALETGYRFLSYGDSSLLWRKG